MEKKKVVPIWLSIILVILCIVSIAANILNTIDLFNLIGKQKFISIADIILFMISSVLALMYCFNGYKKDANKIFKLCSVVFVIALFLQIAYKAIPTSVSTLGQPALVNVEMPVTQDDNLATVNNEYQNTIDIVTSSICFGCMMVLSFAENLGKKKSLLFVAAVIISSLVAYISTLDFNRLGMFSINISFCAFINAVIYGIIVYAKYQDKEARGTK